MAQQRCPTACTSWQEVGYDDKTVKLFNVNDGAALPHLHAPHEVGLLLALMPDGLRFVSGSYDDARLHRQARARADP